jgi:hypothetical protein
MLVTFTPGQSFVERAPHLPEDVGGGQERDAGEDRDGKVDAQVVRDKLSTKRFFLPIFDHQEE